MGSFDSEVLSEIATCYFAIAIYCISIRIFFAYSALLRFVICLSKKYLILISLLLFTMLILYQRMLRRDWLVFIAALQSVFPQSELGTFLALQKRDKERQLQELAMIVTGIRLFNKDCGKGGEGIDDCKCKPHTHGVFGLHTSSMSSMSY